MTIQGYSSELDYVNAQLTLKGDGDKSFLGTFCQACLRADEQNYELIRPALHAFMRKYPANPERLRMERHDRGSQ
jgi:hypothetical protein